MTLLSRLEQWKERGVISPEQSTLLAGLLRREPLSLFLELNILFYAGILAFVAGLGWTVTTWSQQLGDVLIITILSAMLVACFWYCFSRAPAWSIQETASPSLILDYALYLGSLIWSVDLAYIETRFHLLWGQWDFYLLETAGLYFFLAYRFDNRFVLSLALSSLAGWFGLTISRWPSHQDEAYRLYAILYSLIVGVSGAVLQNRGLKPHFFLTYLNVAANVCFWAPLSGVFNREGYLIWLVALVAVCGASLAWGLTQRQFSFAAYAVAYGYVGISSVLTRDMRDGAAVMSYFVFTGIAVLVMLIQIARRFGRDA
jgi:hypothetical protein